MTGFNHVLSSHERAHTNSEIVRNGWTAFTSTLTPIVVNHLVRAGYESKSFNEKVPVNAPHQWWHGLMDAGSPVNFRRTIGVIVPGVVAGVIPLIVCATIGPLTINSNPTPVLLSIPGSECTGMWI